jgi:hypothetical protein
VNNLTVENPVVVSLTGPVTINGILTLNSGELSLGTNTLTLQTSDIPITRSAGTITSGPGSGLSFGSPANALGAAFSIPSGTFTTPPELGNLSIYRTNGITLNEQMLSVFGIVRCDGPLNTNGNLTLHSNASGTALIDGTGTGEISGNVTIQRYLASGFGYKLVSSPFQAATVNEFGDDMDLAASFPAIFRYDENRTSSGWISYVNPANTLFPPEGYAVNFGSIAAPNTVDVTGIVNNGALSVTLQSIILCKRIPIVQSFPSAIDWDASSVGQTNIDNALYYFNKCR